MKIIAGLGNPGAKYETTRHNVGFLAIDRLIEKWNARGPTSKNQGMIYQTTVGGENVYLVKPLTFMNLSGRCIAPLFSFYQCKAEDLIVIHDDLDLKPMMIRLKKGGGTGGHNGLKSIDENLGKENTGYYRIRIGIGHPSMSEGLSRISPVDYVLFPFDDQELAALDPVLDDTASAAEEILQGHFQSAMNKYHRAK